MLWVQWLTCYLPFFRSETSTKHAYNPDFWRNTTFLFLWMAETLLAATWTHHGSCKKAVNDWSVDVELQKAKASCQAGVRSDWLQHAFKLLTLYLLKSYFSDARGVVSTWLGTLKVNRPRWNSSKNHFSAWSRSQCFYNSTMPISLDSMVGQAQL